MELSALFQTFDGLLGDMAQYQGLTFTLPHGVLIVDFVVGYEYPLEDGSVDIVDGYVLDFLPYDELQEPATYFALDLEGVKYLLSEFILE